MKYFCRIVVSLFGVLLLSAFSLSYVVASDDIEESQQIEKVTEERLFGTWHGQVTIKNKSGEVQKNEAYYMLEFGKGHCILISKTVVNNTEIYREKCEYDNNKGAIFTRRPYTSLNVDSVSLKPDSFRVGIEYSPVIESTVTATVEFIRIDN